jgi:hypothetical protein
MWLITGAVLMLDLASEKTIWISGHANEGKINFKINGSAISLF